MSRDPMEGQTRFSDEFLNAFVDDQLVPEEKDRAYLEINQSDALNRQVCELRKMRDLVQLAYKYPPRPAAGAQPVRDGRPYGRAAAAVVLALGVVIGWTLHRPAPAPLAAQPGPAAGQVVAAVAVPPVPASRPVAVPSAGSTAAAQETAKVLIHVSDGRPAHLNAALDEIETLLKYYRASRQPARVEVVLNGEGINMVRAGTSAFAERIARLQNEYDNIVFEACQNTIDRLAQEQGVELHLLPGVTVIDSGVAQIMRRQHQGWAYIQV